MEDSEALKAYLSQLIWQLSEQFAVELDAPALKESLDATRVLYFQDGASLAAAPHRGGQAINKDAYCIVLSGNVVLHTASSAGLPVQSQLPGSNIPWLCEEIVELSATPTTPTLASRESRELRRRQSKLNETGSPRRSTGSPRSIRRGSSFSSPMNSPRSRTAAPINESKEVTEEMDPALVCKRGGVFAFACTDAKTSWASSGYLQPATSAKSFGGCYVVVFEADQLILFHEQSRSRSSLVAASTPLLELVSHLEIFEGLPSEVHARMPGFMRLRSCSAKEAVFQQSDIDNNAYILLSGQVQIRAIVHHEGDATAASSELSSSDGTTNQMLSQFWAGILVRALGLYAAKIRPPQGKVEESEEELREEERLSKEFGPPFASKYFGPGTVFGDKVLKGGALAPRGVSAVCMTDCHLLLFDIDDFFLQLKACLWPSISNPAVCDALGCALEAIQLEDTAEPFVGYQGLTDFVRNGLVKKARLMFKRAGEVIEWQGDEAAYCYAVLKGSVTKKKISDCHGRHKSVDTQCSPMPEEESEPKPTSELTSTCEALAGLIKDILPVAHIKSKAAAPEQGAPSSPSSPGVTRSKSKIAAPEQEAPSPPRSRGNSPSSRGQGSPANASFRVSIQETAAVSGALGPGTLIGVQALQTHAGARPAPHQSNWQAAENCYLLALSREDMAQLQKEELYVQRAKNLGHQLAQLIGELPIFSELDKAAQADIPSIVRYTKRAKGEFLFHEGDAPDKCYIILRGNVRLHFRETIKADPGQVRVVPPALFAFRCTSMASIFDSCARRNSVTIPGSEAFAQRASLLLQPGREVLSSYPARASVCPDNEDDVSDIQKSLSAMDLDVNVISSAFGPHLMTLSAGSVFGELALTTNQARAATAICDSICDFLVIEKHDFDQSVKKSMRRRKEERRLFLCEYIPGMKSLSEAAQGKVEHVFEKFSFPRHHVFAEENEPWDCCVDLIWQGSVEIYSRQGSKEGSFKRCSNLVRGSTFGTMRSLSSSPVTIVAVSSPCEILRLKGEQFKLLPDLIIAGLRTLMETAMMHRLQNSLASPSCKLFGPGAFAPLGQQTCKTAIPMGLSMKVPRPLSKGIRRRPQSGLARVESSPSLPACRASAFEGLFQKGGSEVLQDFEEFCLEPGETLALMATKPTKRQLPTLKTPVKLQRPMSSQAIPGRSHART